jgi:translation initiation factor IF-2
LKGLLEPELVERVIGRANVLATFKVSKGSLAAGCRVIDGEIRRNARVRVLRDQNEIYNGEIAALKREKEDVREVRDGMECGITFKSFVDFQVGDLVECYVMETFGG